MSTIKVEKIQHPNAASVALTLDTSGYLALQAGSASTPAIQGPSDPNTGIFFPAADTIAFAEGGTEALRIDSSGRVGIGTSNPSALFTAALPSVTSGTIARFSSPSYDDVYISAGSSATSCGIGTISSSSFNLYVNSSSRMLIDSSGRVGIGNSSPSYRLDVTSQLGCTHSGAIRHLVNIDSDGGKSYWYNGTPTNTAYIVGDTGGAYFAGRVGIGSASPQTPLSVRTVSNITTYGNVSANFSDNTTGTLYISHSSGVQGLISDSVLAFGSGASGTERARIDSSGRLLVGTSSVYSDSSELFEVHKTNGPNNGWVSTTNLANDDSVSWRALGGVSGVTLRQSGIGVYKHSGIATPCGFLYMQAQNADTLYYWTDNVSNFRISTLASNIGTTGGTVVGTQTSDERIKNVLGPVEYGLNIIKQIEPVRFSLKAEPDVEKLGFIAQQVQPLIPQAIFDTNERIEGEPEDAPTKLGMEYVALIPVLVNALKELSAEVDSLKAQLQAL